MGIDNQGIGDYSPRCCTVFYQICWSHASKYRRLTSYSLIYGFHFFARSSYRRSSHFAIASLFLLKIIASSSNLDLSISNSALVASYQLFTWSCNQWRWGLYRSFLDPNNLSWRVPSIKYITVDTAKGPHKGCASVHMYELVHYDDGAVGSDTFVLRKML